jgi:nitrite reductase/ring-hydroxylating ferredoxin subunit
MLQMSVESYEKGLGLGYKVQFEEVAVAQESEIPEGERKIVEVNGDSIGVFHHKGSWYAIRNVCLHRGGPVATGKLLGDNIVCPWHGYTYDVTTGSLLMDPTARLQTYPVTIRDGQIWLKVLVTGEAGLEEAALSNGGNGAEQDSVVVEQSLSQSVTDLKENEFLVEQLASGQMKLVRVSGQPVVVYNVDNQFYATQNECTHAGGPLNEGELDGAIVTCPWHYSCFDVRDGSVVCKPAVQKLMTYKVQVEGNTGRVEPVLLGE